TPGRGSTPADLTTGGRDPMPRTLAQAAPPARTGRASVIEGSARPVSGHRSGPARTARRTSAPVRTTGDPPADAHRSAAGRPAIARGATRRAARPVTVRREPPRQHSLPQTKSP